MPTEFEKKIFQTRLLIAGMALAIGNAAHAASTTDAPLEPVPPLNVTSYGGHWYQIAFYPNEFQKQCVSDTTADYRLLPYGQIEVVNRCKTAEGTTDEAIGRARLQQPRFLGTPVGKPYSTSRLEVRFAPAILSWFPNVWAPYWVIQLADDYRYTVVSEPTRQYLWILSRTPTLSAADETAIRAKLLTQGFDLSKLVKQPHSAVAK
jgi:apolipoprotein D and lipocalin family protein